jgi:DNA repair protein RadD
MTILYDYQAKAIADIRSAFQSDARTVVFVLATGGGKTTIFTHIAKRLEQAQRRVLILVHRQELIEQTIASLAKAGCQCTVIAPGYTHDANAYIHVASVQALARRLSKLPSDWFNFIITDECHHSVAGTWDKILSHFSTARNLGVTATAIRLDGQGLGSHYQSMVLGPTTAWLTENGYLAKAKIYAPPPAINIKKLRTKLGDFDMKQAATELSENTIYGDCIHHYNAKLSGKTAIAFCCTVQHAENVAAAFNAAGITARSLDAKMAKAERKEVLAQLSTGAIKVVTSCMIISEGTDIPSVNGAILLRPTASLGLCLQMIGRALRPKSDGSDAIILDHVSNVQRHDLLTVGPNGITWRDIEWSLEGKQKPKQDAAPSVRTCPECFAAIPGGTPECPACGHEFTAEERRELEQVAGELQEMAPKGWRPGDAVSINIGASELILENNPRKVDAIHWNGIWHVASAPKMDGWVQIVRDKHVATALYQGRVNDRIDAYWCKMIWLNPISGHKAPRPSARGRTLEELMEIGRQLGYKPGWARRVYDGRRVRQQA